jgi:hypothetical protein
MGDCLSRGQGEAAAATVVGAAASLWPGESSVGVERVDADACQSEIRGLVTAGPLGSSRSCPACLGSSVNMLWHSMFAHRTDAGHSQTLADTVLGLIRTIVELFQSVVEDGQ